MNTVVRKQMPVFKHIDLTDGPQVLADLQVPREPPPTCCRLKDRWALLSRLLAITSDGLQSFSGYMPEETVVGVVRVFNRHRDTLRADSHDLRTIRVVHRAGDTLPPEYLIARMELRHFGI